MLYMFRLQPFDDNVHIVGSPLYHTAVLNFSGSAIHIGHTVVLMDKWTPQQMLHLIDKYRVTNTHMVPTQFVRLLGVPEEERAKYDVSSLAPHGARGGAVPTRHQAADDRVVGSGDRRVLRRERGRRHDRVCTPSGSSTRAPSAGRGRSRRS